MRFSVDAHAIGQHLTGNEAYVRNLLHGFASLDQSSNFIAYLSVESASKLIPERFTKRMVSPNPFVRLGIDLPRQLRQDLPDLIHVQYTAPLACPVPVVVSIHDVSYLEHPEYFTFLRSLQLRMTVERTIRKAAQVLTLSEFSSQAIARSYGLTDENITVVPAAVSSAFRPIARESAAAFVEGRFQIPRPFILNVGDLQPRKNQIGLIHAFEELMASEPSLPHRLVLVGKDTWYSSKVKQAAQTSPCRDRIHFTGYVDEAELLHLYNACELFVFPSFYEGFGLPILEAMACGRAVACSNAAAMLEVADSAAIFFDPYSSTEMARAMRDLLRDNELRSRMVRLGQLNASRFSWQKTASMTLDVYHAVAESRMVGERKGTRSLPVSRT